LNGNVVAQGKYRITWDGKNSTGATLSKGIYFYSTRNESKNIKTGKIVLM
jgi:flagellar hook assembly protein FlgD